MWSKNGLLKIASPWVAWVLLIGASALADEPPRQSSPEVKAEFQVRLVPGKKVAPQHPKTGKRVVKKQAEVKGKTVEAAEKSSHTITTGTTGAVDVPQSVYWVGIGSRGIDEPLRMHLALDHGLLVDYIAPESPATKVGMALYDIVLEVGAKQLNSPEELHVAIEASKGQELHFSILRAGKEQSLKIKPAKRQANAQQSFFAMSDGVTLLHNFVETVGGEVKENGGGVQFRTIGAPVLEGAITPNSTSNIVIEIAGQDEKSVQISIKQNGKEIWVGNKQNNETMPKEVRALLANLVGDDAHPVIVPFQTQKELDELTKLLKQMLQSQEAQKSEGSQGKK